MRLPVLSITLKVYAGRIPTPMRVWTGWLVMSKNSRPKHQARATKNIFQ